MATHDDEDHHKSSSTHDLIGCGGKVKLREPSKARISLMMMKFNYLRKRDMISGDGVFNSGINTSPIVLRQNVLRVEGRREGGCMI